ncbi:MAG: hypothetical protein NUW37_08040 [Planctomycetes bacterium]|nr:hypothetical protein [Planctomycetota bacterium]
MRTSEKIMFRLFLLVVIATPPMVLLALNSSRKTAEPQQIEEAAEDALTVEEEPPPLERESEEPRELETPDVVRSDVFAARIGVSRSSVIGNIAVGDAVREVQIADLDGAVHTLYEDYESAPKFVILIFQPRGNGLTALMSRRMRAFLTSAQDSLAVYFITGNVALERAVREAAGGAENQIDPNILLLLRGLGGDVSIPGYVCEHQSALADEFGVDESHDVSYALIDDNGRLVDVIAPDPALSRGPPFISDVYEYARLRSEELAADRRNAAEPPAAAEGDEEF